RLPLGAREAILGRGCSLADLDGDGRLDVAIAAIRSPEAWKSARPGFPLPGGPMLSSREAMALRSRLSSAVRGSFWLRNQGRGRFISRPLASTASLGWDLAVAAEDLDGDGRAELALGGGFHWPGGAKGRAYGAHKGARRQKPSGSLSSQDEFFFTSVLPRQLTSRRTPGVDPLKGSLGATRGATLLLDLGSEPLDVGLAAGLDLPPGVRALAWADLDRDGRPELLVRMLDGRLLMYGLARPLGRGKVLTLRLVSRQGATSGATVRAQGLERKAVTALDGGATDRPFAEARLGLGPVPRADRVELGWPDGTPEEWQDLDSGGAYTLCRGHRTPLRGLSARAAPKPCGLAPPPSKSGASGETPTGQLAREPEPAPGAGREGAPTLAGLPLGRLPEILVIRAAPYRAAAPRPLRAYLGKAGTIIYFPPSSCPSCPAYLGALGKAAPAWSGRGISVLVLGAQSAALASAAPKGLVLLSLAGSPPAKAPLLGLLIVLDASGRPRTIYLGSQPDVALLDARLGS
ncbi:MAG: VCBS repeat-containing protein, partial [Polyangia bacterium]|nr:VCBS repeat-containing protein [Polyangia bacterium]